MVAFEGGRRLDFRLRGIAFDFRIVEQSIGPTEARLELTFVAERNEVDILLGTELCSPGENVGSGCVRCTEGSDVRFYEAGSALLLC